MAMLWVLMAISSAIATSLTNILAKIGIKDVNSDFASAYRTLIVLFCSALLMPFCQQLFVFSRTNMTKSSLFVLIGFSNGGIMALLLPRFVTRQH